MSLTYWLNTLQNLGDVPFAADPSQSPPPPVLVTLNPASPPRHVVASWTAEHPVPSRAAAAAKPRLGGLNAAAARHGGSKVLLCGAYQGFGFHEDGVKAGFEAAKRLLADGGDVAPPMADEHPMRMSLVERVARCGNTRTHRFLFFIVNTRLTRIRRRSASCTAFLSSFITVGELTVVEPAGAPRRFGRALPPPPPPAAAAAAAAAPPASKPVARRAAAGAPSKENGGESENVPLLSALSRACVPPAPAAPCRAAPFAVASDPRRLRVTLRVLRPGFYWKVATRADLGLADAYVDGDVDVSPSIMALLQLAIANRDAAAAAGDAAERARAETAAAASPRSLLALARSAARFALLRLGGVATAAIGLTGAYWKHLARANSVAQARRNIAAHYDLSNELFSTFLSSDMTYSCAIFDSPDEPLAAAQERKLRSLADRARTSPGMHVLEIGFGWGSLSLLLARHYGVKVTGITLSEQQLALATKRVADAGLSHLIDFKLVDYRVHAPPDGVTYDRIISCEMLEAVGHEFLGDYFRHCARLLGPSPGGLLVVQVITTPEGRYDAYRRSTDFIKEYIFPGCCCPSLSAVTSAAGAMPSNFVCDSAVDIGPHYAPTLLRWRDAFVASSHRVTSLGFGPAFQRCWVYYLEYCAAGFATRTLGDYQLVFSRPGNVAALGNVAFAPEPAGNDHAMWW